MRFKEIPVETDNLKENEIIPPTTVNQSHMISRKNYLLLETQQSITDVHVLCLLCKCKPKTPGNPSLIQKLLLKHHVHNQMNFIEFLEN